MHKPQTFRKKPVEIDAILLTRDNAFDVADWCGGRSVWGPHVNGEPTAAVLIDTPEGTMTASEGDYVIRGVRGEFYPCKPDIFDATYERVQ